MDLVAEWDGQLACALQRALRMNDETFAERLGVHTRTVAMWRQKPSRIPNSELQQALDTVLERADGTCQKRFAILVSAMRRDSPSSSPGASVSSPGDDLTDTAASATIAGDSGDKAAGEGFMGWLQVAHDVTAPPDRSDVGEILRWYRKHENLTQQDVAKLLNTTQSRLSKMEKGAQALRDVTELRYIVRKLGIPDRTSDMRSTPTARRSVISPPSCTRRSNTSPEVRSSPRQAGSRMAPSTWLILSWPGELSHQPLGLTGKHRSRLAPAL